MGLLKIARLGHPAIRAGGEIVNAGTCATQEFQDLLDDLIETMRDADGVGIAAPQVHRPHRAIVIEVEPTNPRYPGYQPVPLTILVNPKMTRHSSETIEDWEGCLSLPDLRGRVPRWRSVTVEAIDRQGGTIELQAEGFFARVLQHEIDHLDGKVFVDRMSDLSTLTHLHEYRRYWAC
ncbi:MAG: peptide deformylase [Nitrospirales bacterium]|nr:peptide deformylase [Nitrospira sp.]MDR4502217.1 peptide deformylase [Nitrospirales bacterium]